ncbi:IS30 family transposase, partial [Patescibacteria group bacterium]|nr:IS30 family transposase [Patescibacteria group bacterium]
KENRLHEYVLEKLKKHWSPEEIVKRMKEEYPDHTNMRISHEAIYQYIIEIRNIEKGNLE